MKKILVIKLGAKGDVIRTLPILQAIKDEFKESELNLVTKSNIVDLLKGIDSIDKLHTLPFEGKEKYDILYNFDIEPEATNLAMKIDAEKKYGFYREDDFPIAFNLGAEYYLNTLFDDDLKKNNNKTYQEMMFEAAEIKYKNIFSEIKLDMSDKEYAKNFQRENNLEGSKLIGVHMGASPRWPTKSWNEENLVNFIKMLKNNNYQVILFAGPDELSRYDLILKKLSEENLKVYLNDPNNSNREFASLVDLCDAIVCSDSFAMHVAIALKKKTIALFFCTSPNEIEPYEYLQKVISPQLYEFFPERSDQYNEELTKSISAIEVFKLIEVSENE